MCHRLHGIVVETVKNEFSSGAHYFHLIHGSTKLHFFHSFKHFVVHFVVQPGAQSLIVGLGSVTWGKIAERKTSAPFKPRGASWGLSSRVSHLVPSPCFVREEFEAKALLMAILIQLPEDSQRKPGRLPAEDIRRPVLPFVRVVTERIFDRLTWVEYATRRIMILLRFPSVGGLGSCP